MTPAQAQTELKLLVARQAKDDHDEGRSPLALAAAGALFVAVSVVACWVPTRRAAAVDPLEALQCE